MLDAALDWIVELVHPAMKTHHWQAYLSSTSYAIWGGMLFAHGRVVRPLMKTHHWQAIFGSVFRRRGDAELIASLPTMKLCLLPMWSNSMEAFAAETRVVYTQALYYCAILQTRAVHTRARRSARHSAFGATCSRRSTWPW